VSLLQDTLGHLHRSALAPRLVLRGSLLTALWVPGRRANDIDFLVEGAWTPQTLRPHVEAALEGLAGSACAVGTIWEETEFPGLRASLIRGEAPMQVDFGWGEQLASAPAPRTVLGLEWPSVCAEVMFGWKAHSLVEHGPRGRWHPKTVADLVLYLRHVPLEREVVRRAIALSFASQRLPLSALDGFLEDPTWGRSRGSRNKWKSYVRKSPWVDFSLDEALAEVRAALLPLVR
jgi:hypothetical protein